MSFAHVTLHVTDLERSVSFYGRLGMPVVRRIPGPGQGIAFLGDGPTKLELIGDGRAAPGEGVSVGFTAADAGALAREMDEKCVGPVSPGPGVEFWFVRDPDGYSVQIIRG